MKNIKIAIIGLGYVGLPLARLFATKFSVVGFDINSKRVSELILGIDSTLEIDTTTLKSVLIDRESDSNGLFCTTKIDEIKDCNYYIITVPTPIDKYNKPVLTPLIKASETVGILLKKGDIVIYESTVYPGATEDDCVPILEKVSGLKFNVDFYVGYSPERINPGDKEHTVDKILKITSGSNTETAKKVNDLYNSVITAGTHLAPTIKVAEAAKVIENSQRDINIAFVNELAKIFNLMDINTHDVLEAAGTKWNFLPFKPGLVGGHCIGVDPYYLTYKAIEVGYNPEMILAGRKLNDEMGLHITSQVSKLMTKKHIHIIDSNILIMGLAFKENCPDIRNTRVIDLIKEFEGFYCNVDVYDPLAVIDEVKAEFDINLIKDVNHVDYDAVIFAVSHDNFLSDKFQDLVTDKRIIFDLKNMLDSPYVDSCL